MANQSFQNYLFNDAGAAIVGATVDLLARNTTTPVLATTTTDANGLWTISHATEGRFDVRITNGSSVRWHKYDTQSQIDTLEVANFRVRNPADTFDYDIVPGAITADRVLNLPVITTTDTLASLGLAQTFSAVQTFTADPTLNDNVNLTFGTGGDVDLYYDGTNFYINPRVVGTGNVIITGTAILFLNDTANTFMTVGLTINQAGASDEALALKSSVIGHGRTGVTETDTYGRFTKADAAGGGLLVSGHLDSNPSVVAGVRIIAYSAVDANATKTTAGIGLITLTGTQTSGNADANVVADGNLVVIQGAAVDTGHRARFIFDTEGSGHADVEWVAFDSYDDLALVHDVEQHLLARESEAGTYNRHALEAAGIIGRDSWHFENGRPRAMVNMTKLAMLHHGALIQVGQRLDARDDEIATLRAEIAELRRALPAA